MLHPAEHLGLPNVEEVKEGVIASRIAAHAADVARGLNGAIDWDNKMSEARSNLDWKKMIELSINPEFSKRIFVKDVQMLMMMYVQCVEDFVL